MSDIKRYKYPENAPAATPISQPDAYYYIVMVEDFGENRAMYLVDENGVAGWYSSYISKIIRPVLSYRL